MIIYLSISIHVYLSIYLSISMYLSIYINILSRAEREWVIDEDFMKAVRKVGENKKLETKLDYKPV